MQDYAAIFLLAVLAALLFVAAFTDLRARTITNKLNAAIALLAVPYWFAMGLSPWPEMSLQIGVAAIVFALFSGMFALGVMGGGDVKLLAALALWLPAGGVLLLLVIMSLAGGVLTLGMLAWHKIRKAKGELEIPYGVAIAFAALCLISERFLYQFA